MWKNYLNLMRFNKPTGLFLLWFPTAWALWMANEGSPPLKLLILFLLGTILMRAAGCVINDIADRHIDIQVKRTQHRPLAAGKISLMGALGLLFVLLTAALAILFLLPKQCIYYAIAAVCITIVYPFCKRFIQAPQLVLGLAFSLGIPMAFAASYATFSREIIYLLVINYLWIVAYDTEYAMADRHDDARIGVKSTAILFGTYDKLIIAFLQIVFHILWWPLVNWQPTILFSLSWIAAGIILIYQQYLLMNARAEECIKAFNFNSYYGALMWLAIMRL